ncbi:hypothetical protein TNCV_25681 [Trichonephila clavipes]|uniref:Uncharacterized protein n=1 Tax=Trichonephila clavipes TaxID=2585209 RepID=A0A8X7BBX3_TRICX|nr:hypothetical protein TNCV_25681 [Trichonephila clavipes]
MNRYFQWLRDLKNVLSKPAVEYPQFRGCIENKPRLPIEAKALGLVAPCLKTSLLVLLLYLELSSDEPLFPHVCLLKNQGKRQYGPRQEQTVHAAPDVVALSVRIFVEQQINPLMDSSP